jgi:5-methylcytosine-specific restriction endonuclease McrA
LFGAYRDGARKRGLTFELSLEDFIRFTTARCAYCGIEPSQQYKNKHHATAYTYNGIDRVDNELGYILENCVTCCKACNRLKGWLSEDVFLATVERIHAHQLALKGVKDDRSLELVQ